MKLFFKYCMLILVLTLASCEPGPIKYPTLNPEKVVLKVGEEANIELIKNDYRLHHVRIGGAHFAHEHIEQVCEISDVKDLSFKVKALHLGVDTVIVEYRYTMSIFAYSSDEILPICVEE